MQNPSEIVPVNDAPRREAALALITEYLDWVAASAAEHAGLRFDVAAMQAADLATAQGLFLVRQAGAWVGVGALRRLSATEAELQRMFVRPPARGRGAGQQLLQHLLAEARAAGYRTVRLESLRFLVEAQALYRSAGFREVPGYPDHSMQHYQAAADLARYPDSAVFMELALGSPQAQPIDLAGRLATFEGHWQPRTVCEYNGHDVMVVKVQGEYHWHSHPDTDDFFLVLKGQLEIDLAGGATVHLGPGQMYVVPRGVQHRPRALQEAHLLLIEPTGTPNSGDAATAAPRRVI